MSRYGVYLSSTYDQLPKDIKYDTIIIDAQYFSADEIKRLKENNTQIYSYINIGSIEDFRDYYKDYKNLILGPYENWPDEYWINVEDKNWQTFITDTLAMQLKEKGIDGFFVDNADVYYHYNKDGIYDGITSILKSLKAKGMKIIINGGDTYVMEYFDRNKNLDDILDGVNQESVFTSIDWENETFTENDEDTRQYYLDYLDRVSKDGKTVYVLEYTKDKALIQRINSECNKLNYNCYISNSLELD